MAMSGSELPTSSGSCRGKRGPLWTAASVLSRAILLAEVTSRFGVFEAGGGSASAPGVPSSL